MRAYDIIEKKRDDCSLSKDEIRFLIEGYVNGEIPDYQMSAFLMAVYFNGMTDEECESLTECMLNSGDQIDLSGIDGIKVDKHSTGGVGDKTTLVVIPIVAACGVKAAKMSGRGLGHTGGTVDKLESIPGFNIALEEDKFFEIVNKIGCSVISQTGDLVPADKKIYALRDVTATVESKPLIASSIMSKKIASGADCILLDIKVGSGAFMRTLDDAVELSQMMVKIGTKFGRKVTAVITDMNSPLGRSIGNALEVYESCQILRGVGPDDLREVSLELAANMLCIAGKGTLSECLKMAENALESGAALDKFKEMIKAQGGTLDSFLHENFTDSRVESYNITVDTSGFIHSMNAEDLGKASMILGAGREKKEDAIDYGAGIVLHKKTGDKIESGDVLATLYSSKTDMFAEAEKILRGAVAISSCAPDAAKLIKARITENGIEMF